MEICWCNKTLVFHKTNNLALLDQFLSCLAKGSKISCKLLSCTFLLLNFYNICCRKKSIYGHVSPYYGSLEWTTSLLPKISYLDCHLKSRVLNSDCWRFYWLTSCWARWIYSTSTKSCKTILKTVYVKYWHYVIRNPDFVSELKI